MAGIAMTRKSSATLLFMLIKCLLYLHGVYAPDSLIMKLDDQPVEGAVVQLLADGTFTFQCIHSSSAAISWRLGTTDKTQKATADNKLTLSRVSLECGLDLVCSTPDSLSVSVTLKIIIPPEQPVISQDEIGAIENGGNAMICHDKTYTFHCAADAITPAADFHWFLDGTFEQVFVAPSNESDCSRADSRDSFTFKANYYVHQGKILQCRASNEANPSGMTSEVILDVTVPPDKIAISKDGIESTNSVQVIADAPSIVTCTAFNAKPAASIDWFLGSFNKTYASEESAVDDRGLKDTISELSLIFIFDWCKTTLTCVASHPETGTELSTSVSMNVLVPPEMPTISRSDGTSYANDGIVFVTQNETYVFECLSEGAIPAVDFQWLLGGQIEDNYLASNEYISCDRTSSSFQYTFTVDHLKHHTETLQCLVKNEANTNGVASQITLSVDALIGFQETTYTVSESDPELEIIVRLFRVGPLNEEASVRLSVSQRSTAEAGSDYRSASILPVTVDFDDGSSTIDVMFYLENDGEFELTEELILMIDTPIGGQIIASRNTTVIAITDSGGRPKCSSGVGGTYSGCKDLDTLSKFPVSRDNIGMVAETLADLTEGIPTSKATPSDVNAVARTLENVADVQDGSVEITMSCVEAVDSIIDGLRPVPRNDSDDDDIDDDDDDKMDIANATSSIVESLEEQIKLTLRKDGSVRIIEPNIVCEGVIIGSPGDADNPTGGGIGIVILRDDGSGMTTADSTPTTTSPVTRTTPAVSTTTAGSDGLVPSTFSASTAAPDTTDDDVFRNTTSAPPTAQESTTPSVSQPPVQFTNETVVVIDDINDVLEEDTIGLVFVPNDYIGTPIDNATPETEVVFICYANPGLFPPDDDDDFVDGVVISADVEPKRPNVTTETPSTVNVQNPTSMFTQTTLSGSNATDGQTTPGTMTTAPITTERPDLTSPSREPVIIEVVTTKRTAEEDSVCDERSRPVIHRCVFWDFELRDGKGGWSTEGCYLNSSAEGKVTCHCNHLTNFAVLASYKDFQHLVLDWISTIGCYVSIGALTLTLLIFLIFKEPRQVLMSKAPRQVLFQYCISLLLLYIAFIVFIDRTCPRIYCDVGAIVLHYFTLTSMMWMGVQSRYLYYKLTNAIYMDFTWFLPVATLSCWALPAIPVALSVVYSFESYQNEEYCFLLPGYVLYFGLLLPIGIILLHNLISFVIIMNRLCRNTLPNPGEPERLHLKRQLQNGLAISVLTGTTWALAFLAIGFATFLFALLFCVINSLQGLFIFLLFCLRQPDVRAMCKCCRVTRRQRSFEADWEPGAKNNPAFAMS